ncbi:hypothetical protein CHS0354_009540 [Potamilus streckersoni]|uniref:VWFA domain-containing protein n=1 Tax=Potamilus streckersoni TaxID=2493646 RepID=A0AAE0SQ61_9BIVA|nr:hypothetical protein CHS0354_009540 [Potamilus streckersoni]
MATIDVTGYVFRILALVILIHSCVISSTSGRDFPSLGRIEKWASKLSGELVKSAKAASGYDFFNRSYNEQLNEKGRLSFESINGSVLVAEMAEKLADVLGKKMQALNRSVVAAEEAAANHTWNPKIKKEDVEYVNSKDLLNNDTRLVYHERFKQKVSPNFTSVHIPVEIYDGIKLIPQWTSQKKVPRDVEILNGLKWSGALDQIFRENFDNDPHILWQYFGSQTGFMRTLPASQWRTPPGQVDLYDVRRRPWYIQGSSSPKDMMIIIDTSGSVHGQALQLMKVTVRSLLDTLGENDFVNIAKFDTKASFVSCFKTFVQANYRNKEILSAKVDELVAKNQADYSAGFTFAFEQFIQFDNGSKNGQGANCNKLIMLLTDGGSDTVEDVFKKYNWPEKKVRVFTYAVGPTASPVSAIRWMACANKGYFSQIPAMGAIRSKVQGYMKAFIDDKAYNNVSDIAWAISADPRGLGMMTTVTLPVYNRTRGSSNQTILGVMGIDVTTDEMQKYSPAEKLGPNGYSFAINSNGYIIFHPGLKIRGNISEPPNVDFLEVEVENERKVALRTNMIDITPDKVGQDVLVTYELSPDERHVDRESRVYSYTGIRGTTFSLGICLPSDKKYHLKVELDFSKFDLSMLNKSNTELLIADTNFENFTTTENQQGRSEALRELLSDLVQGNTEIDQEYEYRLKHLLWDINITDSFDGYWKTLFNTDKKAELGINGMIGAFIGTYGGLTRIFPKSLADEFEDQRNLWDAEYFRRAIDSPDFMFSVPYSKDASQFDPNSTDPHITVVKAVSLEEKNYKIAVAGAVFTHDSVRIRMQDASVDSASGQELNCLNSDFLTCYLLDDGAFIIATNQEDKLGDVGRFFGKVDPHIMIELYNRTYNRLEQYDYQGLCDSTDDDVSAGPSIFRIPSFNLLYEVLTVNWWKTAITWSLYNFNLYNWLFGSHLNQVEASNNNLPRSCIKKRAQYYFRDEFNNYSGTIECEIKNCSWDFTAMRVQGTNLLLLVTEPHLQGVCENCIHYIDPTILIQEPIEVIDEPDYCNMEPRYRKRPEGCWDSDVQEDTSRCSGPRTNHVSSLLILISVIFACPLRNWFQCR